MIRPALLVLLGGSALIGLATLALGQTVTPPSGGSGGATSFTLGSTSVPVPGTTTSVSGLTLASPTLSGTVAGTYTLGGTPTLTAGTLSGITTLPGSGNSIDASGNASFGNVNVTGSTSPVNGIYLSAGNTVTLNTNSLPRIVTSASVVNVVPPITGSTVGSYQLTNAASSSTVPNLIPDKAATTTGFGGDGTSLFGIIAGSAAITWGAGGETINGSGQLNVAAMTQTGVAQSGTICYNSGTGAVTYDSTVGCLTSLEEQKNIAGPIKGALGEVMKIKPFWFTWKEKPEDKAEQPGMGAHQVEGVDKRLAAYGADGKLRGVRYQEMTAVLVAAIQEQQVEIDNLKKMLKKLTH